MPRKIDQRQYLHFLKTLEKLIEDLDGIEQQDVADEMAIHGSELETAFREYNRSLLRLERSINRYAETFDMAFSSYKLASRHKTRIRTKM